MNALHNHPVPPIYTATMVCPDCEGTCTQTVVARVAGEAYDADWVEIPCEACHAEGEVDAVCEGCCRMVPCCDGYCAECNDYQPILFVPVTDLGNGRHGVGL